MVPIFGLQQVGDTANNQRYILTEHKIKDRLLIPVQQDRWWSSLKLGARKLLLGGRSEMSSEPG